MSSVIKQFLLVFMTLIMFFPLYIVFIMGTYYSEDIFKAMPVLPSNYIERIFSGIFKLYYSICLFCSDQCPYIYYDWICSGKI